MLRRRERRLGAVPRAVVELLLVGLLAQGLWHFERPGPIAEARRLGDPPTVAGLRLVALGDPIVLAKTLMLWLQAHDNQPGVSIPFRDLDYHRVALWLGRILDLDPRGQYPLLAAARVYGAVDDPARQRIMLDFVYRRFLQDPDRRWRWLAHAALIAKHQLHDMPLALRYARAITAHATGPSVPAWARDMTFIVLQDMGELQAARIVVGGLIASGQVKDPHELWFLERKLDELKREAGKGAPAGKGAAPAPPRGGPRAASG